jgi:hypothetical protein
VKRAIAFVLTSGLSLLVGGVAGAALTSRACDRELGHSYVFGLMNDAWAAREIYAGRGRQHADRLRERFPELVLGVEKEFRQDPARDTALRVVREAYAQSGEEIPVSVRGILIAVPASPYAGRPNAQK